MFVRAKPIVVCALALLFAAVSSSAAEKESDQKTATAKDPVKCKRVATLGSHMKKRVCLKKSQWREMQAEAQRAAQNRQNRSVSSPQS